MLMQGDSCHVSRGMRGLAKAVTAADLDKFRVQPWTAEDCALVVATVAFVNLALGALRQR